MPLFKSKPKLSIEECCRQFYDYRVKEVPVKLIKAEFKNESSNLLRAR